MPRRQAQLAALLVRNHPLADAKFASFIFCLIPVQTLFAYNYFILPPYVKRAFEGTWIGDHYEVATQFNSLLIFILCPIVAALTTRMKIYTVMILGTAVMALPTFILGLGPTVPGLFTFLVLMTLGEAIWQPRFLQFPGIEGRPPREQFIQQHAQRIDVAGRPHFLRITASLFRRHVRGRSH